MDAGVRAGMLLLFGREMPARLRRNSVEKIQDSRLLESLALASSISIDRGPTAPVSYTERVALPPPLALRSMRPVQGVGQRCSRLVRAYTSLPWACAGSSPLPADPSPPSPQLARAPWLRAAEARASPRLASTPPRGAAARARPQHARSTWEARHPRRRRPSRSRGGCSTGDARTPDLPALAREPTRSGTSHRPSTEHSCEAVHQWPRQPRTAPTSPRQEDAPEGNAGISRPCG